VPRRIRTAPLDGLRAPRRIRTASLDRELCWRLLRIGLPTAAEQLAFQLGLLVFLWVIALYGTPALSAYLIGVRILSICFVPGLGFSTAAATLVGQHLGGARPDAATRAGWRAGVLAVAVMGGVGLSIGLGAERLARIFGAAGAETVALSVTFIHILGAAQPLMALEFALGGALRGAGDTRFPLLAILTGLFVFRLGAAFAIARPWFDGVTAVWLCLLADYAVKALMLGLRFASGRWQAARV
jgi:Na+-driven multidrug efflux pump